MLRVWVRIDVRGGNLIGMIFDDDGQSGMNWIYVPRVAAEIDVLDVSPNSYRLSLRVVCVDAVDWAERIHHGFVIRKPSRRAGLERRVVAGRGRIEGVDRSQNGIGISTVPNRLGVDVRDHVFLVIIPVALRQEAQHLRRLGFARCACLSDPPGQRLTFDQSAMLHGGREEGRAVDFLP